MWYSHDFRDPPEPQNILEPKNQDRYFKIWRDYGPVAIQNVTEGLRAYIWELAFVNGWWVIYRTDDIDGTIQQVVDTGLEEAPEFADISFDTAARVFIAWETMDGINIYWFDPTIPGFTTTLRVPDGKNCFSHLDYRIVQQQEDSDIILTYERDNAVYYRITSDRYTVEYPTPFTDLGNRRIMRAGVGDSFRYTIYVA